MDGHIHQDLWRIFFQSQPVDKRVKLWIIPLHKVREFWNKSGYIVHISGIFRSFGLNHRFP